MPRSASVLEPFAELFERYKNLVYKTAFLLLGDAGEAEDALQEVFLRVHHSLSSYDPARGAFTTWLHRITVNYCLGLRRKRRLLFEPLDEDQPAPGARNEAPDGSRSEIEVMQQAIRRLSEKQRVVLILRYYWELPYAEIAQILDIPLGTVKSRIDLALRTLRSQLTGQEENPFPGCSPRVEVES